MPLDTPLDAPRMAARARLGKGGIVDIAGIRQPLSKSRRVGRGRVIPPAFANLARQIGRSAGTRRR